MKQKLLVDVLIKPTSVSLHFLYDGEDASPRNRLIELPLDPEVRITRDPNFRLLRAMQVAAKEELRQGAAQFAPCPAAPRFHATA